MEAIHRTLVLSQGYEPIKIVSWQRTITSVITQNRPLMIT